MKRGDIVIFKEYGFMKKVFEVIGFYVAFFSIVFYIGYFAPWIVIGLGIGALLVGISKGVKMAFLGLRKRWHKK